MRVLGECSETEVDLLDQHPADQPSRSDLPAIETDVVRAQSGHQALDIEEAMANVPIIGGWQLEHDLAALSVEIEGQQSVFFLEALHMACQPGQRAWCLAGEGLAGN